MITVGSLGYGGQQLNHDLPNILKELQGLTISGPLTGAAASTAIAVTDGIEYWDTIVKVLMNAAGTFTDITSTTSAVDRRASGTITLASQPSAGDTITFNGKVYTFASVTVTTSTNLAPRVVPLGSTTTVTAANLVTALKSQDDTATYSSSTNVVTIKYATLGTAGNSIALATSNATAITLSGSTLTGGTATNAIVSTTATTGDQVFVVWYNKPTSTLQP
jgi:hypothetical protein